VESELNSQAIANLPYLDAAIKETLRIYPIAASAFARVLTQPMSIMGNEFAAKTWFVVSIYNLHHQEEIYPNAEQFIPERFLTRNYSNLNICLLVVVIVAVLVRH